MAVPNSMADLATLAGSNSPAGSEAIGNSLDNYLRAHAAIIRSTNAIASATIAAASTTDLATADGESVQVTGSATITSLGTGFAGCKREVRFTGVCTIVHSASLALPGNVNITTTATDFLTFRCLSPGTWACVGRAKPAITSADVTGALGYTPVNKAGDTVTGSLFMLSQGANPVIGFMNAANTFRRYYANHDDNIWTLNTCDNTGALLSTAFTAARLTGNTGIQNTSPDSYQNAANTLVIGNGVGNRGVTIVSGAANVGGIHFADGTVGDQSYRGIVYYNHAADGFEVWTAGVKKLDITSAGDIVASGGITVGGGKKISNVQVSSAAPGALADGTLYLRY